MIKKTSNDHEIEVPTGVLKVETYRAGIQQRHREPNKSKYIIERRWGDDWFADRKCWVTYERLIDRDRDIYRKRYVDQETGAVIYECEEPLTKHRDRGSVKFKND